MTGILRVLLIAILVPTSSWAQEAKPVLDRFGDPLPPHAIARLGTARFRGPLYHVRFSADGKTLLTFGHDTPLVLFWDAETGRPLNLVPTKNVIRAADFSQDGKRLAVHDGRLRMLDAKTVKEAWSADVPARRLVFSPDGKLLAALGDKGVVYLRKVETGELVHELKSPDDVDSIDFAADSKLLAGWGSSGTTKLWNTHDGKLLKILRTATHRGKFTREPHRLLIITHDLDLVCWDVDTGKPIFQTPRRSCVHGIAVHPDGKIAAAGADDGAFEIWNLADGKQLQHCHTPMGHVFGVAFSPDGTKLAISGEGALEIWDTATWKPIRRFDGPTAPAQHIAFADQGKFLVSSHGNCPHFQLHRWNLADTTNRLVLEKRMTDGRPNGTLMRHTLSNDGRWLAGTEWTLDPPNRAPIHVWETQKGEKAGKLDAPALVGTTGVAIASSRLVAHGQGSGYVIWDLVSGKQMNRLGNGEFFYTHCLSLSPRADWLASAETSGVAVTTIVLWNTALGKREYLFGTGKENTQRRMLAISPADRSVADGSFELDKPGVVRKGPRRSWIDLWEPYSGQVRRQFADFPDELYCLAFSPDGRHLATGHATGAIRIWDMATEKLIAELDGHRGGIGSIVYHPDGRSLASSSADATILIWKAPPAAKPGAALTEKTLEQFWDDLANLDARKAYTAMLACRDHPGKVVPFLQRKLIGDPGEALKRVPQWLADLDSPTFQTREFAFQELMKLGRSARPALLKALEKPPSLEAKRRFEGLLDKLNASTADVRVQRSIETLQLIGTPEALAIVKNFATH